jgi:hypothetical protein
VTRELEATLAEYVPSLAATLIKRFATLDPDEVEMECWAAVLAHQDELGAISDPVHVKADARQYATKAILSMRREQDRDERAAKALLAGYAPEDEVFYTPRMLRSLLPHYLDNGISPAPARGRELVPPASDPAESGNWIALMIDVDFAFWKVSKDKRKTLARYFSYPQGSGGWTHVEIASAMGIQPVVLEGRIKRALRSMERLLDGSDPRVARHESASRWKGTWIE